MKCFYNTKGDVHNRGSSASQFKTPKFILSCVNMSDRKTEHHHCSLLKASKLNLNLVICEWYKQLMCSYFGQKYLNKMVVN